MKNKKAVYILLPLVLLLWGIIFYMIFSAVNPSYDQQVQPRDLSINVSSENPLSDTFSIIANYRDPFLGKVFSSEKPVVRDASINSTPVKPIVIPKSWPSISYGGMMKIIKSSKQVALIYINGGSKMMKTGEIKEEVELLKIYNDSVEVMFHKEKRVVKK